MDEFLYLWAQWGVLDHKTYSLVVAEYGDLKSAWRRITAAFWHDFCQFGREKAERIMAIRERIDLRDITRAMAAVNAQLYFFEDDAYPTQLKNIYDPPVFLWVRGRLPTFERAIGVVGTRRMTDYGRRITEKLTEDLVAHGLQIVSGLALGVDACAHHTALKCGGETMAVLGSGVDVIAPHSHYSLAQAILGQNGGIVSELPLGSPPLPHHFPERNRIVAGLCRGLLVTEGGVKSGALITGRLAFDQNRTVFAVPDSLAKQALNGTHWLIKKDIAKLVENVDDILEDFYDIKRVKNSSKATPLTPDEKELLSILRQGAIGLEALMHRTGKTIVQLSTLLVHMELKGVVTEVGYEWTAV